MKAKFFLPLLTLFVVVGVTGCQPDGTSPVIEKQSSALSNQTITITSLADQLGLRIVETSDVCIKLKNSANTVVIFTGYDARFFVNGRAKGAVENVEKIGGRIYVPASLVPEIRSEMLAVAPKEQPPRPGVNPYTGSAVVIDAGHGGKDPGAIARNGTYEKYINLAVAEDVASILRQKGISVIMTRSNDTFVELDGRSEIANNNRARLFVSIHSNSSENSSARGYTVYTSRSPSSASQSLGQALVRSMSSTGFESHGLQHANYRVVVNTNCPSALVEIGYLSNSSEASMLTSSNTQNRIAQAIAQGICDTLSANNFVTASSAAP